MAINTYIANPVSQTITDGVTNKAPSENVVFDALSGKESHIKDTNGKAWVIYGDSLSNDLVNDYPSLVASKLGLTPTTYAVSGNKYVDQLAVITSQIAGNANFFDSFDYCSIHLGINDFAGNQPLGSLSSLNTDANIAGYLKKMIELILTSNPSITLFIITPTEANGAGVVYKSTTASGYTLSMLSNLAAEVCAYYGVQCIDLYNLVNFNLVTIPTLTTDGLHPSADGKELIANVVASGFRNLGAKGRTQNIGAQDIQVVDTVRKVSLKGSTLSEMLQFNKSTGANILSILGNGNVGIGTVTPSKALSIGSRILFGDDGVASWGSAGAHGQLTWDTGKAIINGLGSNAIELQTGNVQRVFLATNGDVVLGRQQTFATNQQTGMIYIPQCAGIPTGSPAAYTGKVSLLFNSTDNILNVYNGAWKKFQSIISGITGSRPTVTDVGYQYFDTTLGIPIWWNGSVWVNSAGATV